jgi:8-amino-7-oxononanoate synthase
LCEGLTHVSLIGVHTCGKSLGVSGALVSASELIVDYLVNKARPFVYATASPPLLPAALIRALELIDEEPWRRAQLLARANFAHQTLSEVAGDALRFAGSQIIPVVLGGEERTLKVASALQDAGFDVRAIRPPTVPMGTSRLRISINAMQSETDISELSDALGRALGSA